jgi:hypothetical protein
MTENLPEPTTTKAASASGEPPRVIVVTQPGRQTVWWVLTVVLAVIATALVTRRDDADWATRALGQVGSGIPQAGARGIYAFTGQLTSKSYGLFMMDVDSGTVWCYEMQHGPNGDVQLKLVAARSWLYDRYLEEFNVADPVPSAVQAMVQQRQAAQRQGGSTGTGVPATSAAP